MSARQPADAPYVLGVNQAELDRLGLQHQLWSEAAHALWERAGIQPGSTVLDVGCGPGFATFDLGQIVGRHGRILAVDQAGLFLDYLAEQARRRELGNVTTHRGDVQDLAGAGIPDGRADAAYARWVFCFVPDPAAVVRGIHRALRPGGVFTAQDYFNYETLTLAPRTPSLSRFVAAVGKSWRDRGGNPDIVGSLPGILHQSGFDVREITPHLRIARPGSPLWQWPTTFIRNFLPELVKGGYLTERDQTDAFAEWDAASRSPSSFFFCPPVFDIIAVKR